MALSFKLLVTGRWADDRSHLSSVGTRHCVVFCGLLAGFL